MPVPRSGAGATQVRRTRLQHPVRVHRWRPADLHQPAQDVPGRVQGHSLQGWDDGDLRCTENKNDVVIL